MTDALQDYRLEAEKQYSSLIARLVNQGQEQLTAMQLSMALAKGQREELEKITRRSTTPTDVKHQLSSIEREVCQLLLYYLQKSIYVRDQQMLLVGQTLLENEQVRCNLLKETAEAINAAVRRNNQALLWEPAPQQVTSSAESSEETKQDNPWWQYDQLLFIAMQQGQGTLSGSTKAQLKLLQVQLGMPDDEVPPVEKLRSRLGVNYIPLWRLLQQKNWHTANEETHRCLVKAGGQKTHDSQLIDIERIASPALKTDLETLDRLWSESSRGQFGFKIQRQLWQEVDPNLKDLEALGRKLDWRRRNSWISYDAVTFSKGAVPGHLPTFPYIGWWCWVGGMKAILEQFASEESKSPVG